ncbi:MAG: SpoIVB peptidase [Clostridia bacterium]|nr:SpoIVB peptidase [Clostridia bacterium]
MNFIRSHKKRFVIFLAVCFTVIALSYIITFSVLPGNITLLEGEEYIYHFKSPLFVNITADKAGIIKLNNGDIKTSGSFVNLSNPISLKSQGHGSVKLNLRFLGLIPIKTLKVDIVPNKKVIACGNTVGVKLQVDGILVIGVSAVETESGKRILPAKESGIETGDLLMEANRTKLESVDDLINEISNSGGKAMRIKYKHGSSVKETEVKPEKSEDDEKYHIGLWVRDSTAGIGTLTFYDPDTKYFGALGHGITDIDTGTLMPVREGEILESNILSIKKGRQGNPGELKGIFTEGRSKLGSIVNNSEHGIYGQLEESALSKLPEMAYPIALRNTVKEGEAQILANIDGKTIEKYNVEIEKVSRQNSNSSKGMLIKIVDKRLLDTTGGIVQGMSGSPIIQNGKIIGAVTHVLINDPTRGYGIFIEKMIKNIPGSIKAG